MMMVMKGGKSMMMNRDMKMSKWDYYNEKTDQ